MHNFKLLWIILSRRLRNLKKSIKTCWRRSKNWWTMRSRRWIKLDQASRNLDKWLEVWLTWGSLRWTWIIGKSLGKSQDRLWRAKVCYNLIKLEYLPRKPRKQRDQSAILISSRFKIKQRLWFKTKFRCRKKRQFRSYLKLRILPFWDPQTMLSRWLTIEPIWRKPPF